MKPAEASAGLAGAVRTLTAGAVVGFLAIMLSISSGNLLLAGGMREFLPTAIGMALFSSAAVAVIAALTSPIKGAVAIVQPIPLVVIATMGRAVANGMTGQATPQETLIAIVAMAMLATFATGVVLLVLGFRGLGGLTRYVPFPVIGGFLAGSGWLILERGAGVILGESGGLGSVDIASAGLALRCGGAVLFIAVLAILQWRFRSNLILPLASFAAIVLFNLAVFASGATTAALQQVGWVVALPAGGTLWPPVPVGALAAVDWSHVLSGITAFPGLISVTVMALLMNATGIEYATGSDVDLDRELRSVGLQNLLSGAGGGLPGFTGLSLTLLGLRLGAANRMVGVLVAVLVAGALFLGRFVLGLVPTPLLGSLLVWVGGSLIGRWLILSPRRVSIREYLVILVIFVVIVAGSFPLGILAGLAAAVVLFVLEYGRLDTVRHVMRGSQYQSNAGGSKDRREALRRHGDAILFVSLQGYLFFGTAERLRLRILGEIGAASQSSARFVVIDFRHVSGLDSSAALSFVRLIQVAERDGLMVVATGTSAAVESALQRGGLGTLSDPPLRFEPDSEQGLAWCEDALLARVAPGIGGRTSLALDQLLRQMVNDNDLESDKLLAYFERVELAAGAILIEQGSPSDDIYAIESGRASVFMETSGGRLRIAGVGTAAIVGEVAFYLAEPRTASVIADEPMVAWRFTRAGLERLQAEMPTIAVRLHQGLARTLADRLASANRLIRILAE